jgi:protein CMS1
MSAEDNLDEPLLERLSPTPEPNESTESKSSSKRKRDAEQDQSSKNTAKRRKNNKNKVVVDDELDIELGINKAFSHMDKQLLADYMAQRTRQYEGDLSSVELEDKYIPGT